MTEQNQPWFDIFNQGQIVMILLGEYVVLTWGRFDWIPCLFIYIISISFPEPAILGKEREALG
jgi:hypothetical protein